LQELAQDCNHLQFIMHGRDVGMDRIFVTQCWGLGMLRVANLVINGSSSSMTVTEFLEQM